MFIRVLSILALLGALIAYFAFSAGNHGPSPRAGNEATAKQERIALTPSDDRSSRVEVAQTASPTSAHPTPENQSAAENALTLLVTADTGAAVEGASIRLYRRPMGDDLRRTQSDSAGRAELQNALPGDEIAIEAKGFEPNRFFIGDKPWPSPLLVTLSKSHRSIRGGVVNDLGSPVAGASISLTVGKIVRRSTSETDGSFSISLAEFPPSESEIYWKIAHPDHVFLGQDIPWTKPPRGEGLAIKLHRWAAVVAQITDDSGATVERASLRFVGPPDADDRERLPGDADVAFTFSSKPAAFSGNVDSDVYWIEKAPPLLPLWLRVESPGFFPSELALTPLQPGERRRVSMTLARTSHSDEVRWLAVDENGNRIAGAEAWLKWKNGLGTGSEKLHPVGPGEFVASRIGERCEIHFSADGFLPETRTVARGSASPSETVVLRAGQSAIYVRVIDSNDRPVPSLLIELIEQGGSGIQKALKTNDEGQAIFMGLDPRSEFRIHLGSGRPGSYFWKEHRSEVPSPAARRNVRPESPEITFRLVPPASVSGSIQGKSLIGKIAFLSAMDPGDPDRPPPLFTVSCTIGDENSFFFAGLPPGDYRLWVEELENGSFFTHPLASWSLAEGQKLYADVSVR